MVLYLRVQWMEGYHLVSTWATGGGKTSLHHAVAETF